MEADADQPREKLFNLLEFSPEGVPELRRRKVHLHLKVDRALIRPTGTAEADESVGVTGNESRMLHKPEQLFGVEKSTSICKSRGTSPINKTTSPGPPQGPRHRAIAGSYGGAFSYERGTVDSVKRHVRAAG